jgi:hypothetical protein
MVIRSSLQFIRQNSLRRFDQSSGSGSDNNENSSSSNSNSKSNSFNKSAAETSSGSSSNSSNKRDGMRDMPRRSPSLRGSFNFLRSNSLRRFDQQAMAAVAAPKESQAAASLAEVQELEPDENSDSGDAVKRKIESHDSFSNFNSSFTNNNNESDGSFSSYQPSQMELDSSESNTSYDSENDILEDDDDDLNSLCESDDSNGSETCTTVTGSLYSGHPGSEIDGCCNDREDEAIEAAADVAVVTEMPSPPCCSSPPLDRRKSFKRSNSSKRNVVVTSAIKSAKFLRGIVRANSAKTLMNVLQSTESVPLDMSADAKQVASSSSSCCKASNNRKNAPPELRKPQRTISPGMRKPERALSGMLVPSPPETPSRPTKPYHPFGVASIAPTLPAGFVDEEPSMSKKNVGIKKNRRVMFASNEDGSVKCTVQRIHRIEEKEDCWYSVDERNDSSDNFTSVVEYYQDNAEYVESLKRLYNIARLTAEETERHLQTLANHPHARGLENYIVRKGSVLRRKHTCRVLAAQDVAQWASSSELHLTDDEDDSGAFVPQEKIINTDDANSWERLSEELRRVSVVSSQRCQRLAYQMASFDTNEALIAVCSPWQTQRRKWHSVLRTSLSKSSRTLSNNSENGNNKDNLMGIANMTPERRMMSSACGGDQHSRAPKPVTRSLSVARFIDV